MLANTLPFLSLDRLREITKAVATLNGRCGVTGATEWTVYIRPLFDLIDDCLILNQRFLGDLFKFNIFGLGITTIDAHFVCPFISRAAIGTGPLHVDIAY